MKNLRMEYTQHYKEESQGSIFIEKSGACNITLTGASGMSQNELNEYGKLFANAPQLLQVLTDIVKSHNSGMGFQLRLSIAKDLINKLNTKS